MRCTWWRAPATLPGATWTARREEWSLRGLRCTFSAPRSSRCACSRRWAAQRSSGLPRGWPRNLVERVTRKSSRRWRCRLSPPTSCSTTGSMMNAFEPLFWVGAIICAVRAMDRGDDRYWLGFGVIVGVGLEFKYSIAFLGAGLLAGLMLTSHRKTLQRPTIWWGVLICALLALPNFIWQATNGFPFLELMRNIKAGNRDVIRAPLAFIVDQAEIMHPVLAPLWIGGLLWLLLGRDRRRLAVFGWAFLFVLCSIMALKGKNYYVTPVYPLLFAAGAVGFEALTSGRGGWLRAGYRGGDRRRRGRPAPPVLPRPFSGELHQVPGVAWHHDSRVRAPGQRAAAAVFCG